MTRLLRVTFAYTTCCVLSVGLTGRILAQSGTDPLAGAVLREQTTSATASSAKDVSSSDLPDSPGAEWQKTQDATPQQTSPVQSSTTASAPAGTPQGGIREEQAQEPQHPVGTAAAEAPDVKGVTAAQPAGVAIAPAKQHRVRTIVLRVGAMVGAGVAVGSVIALTESTPSKPPGAR